MSEPSKRPILPAASAGVNARRRDAPGIDEQGENIAHSGDVVAFDQQDRCAETRHAEASRGCGDGWGFNGLHRNHADRLRKRELLTPREAANSHMRARSPLEQASHLGSLPARCCDLAKPLFRQHLRANHGATRGPPRKAAESRRFPSFPCSTLHSELTPSKASRNKLRRAKSA